MTQLGERRGTKHGMKSATLAWRGMLEGTINPAKGESMTDQETPERAHVTADDIEAANDLIDFIEACPSMFHTAATIMAELDEAGFTYLPENAAWDIEPGGRYYTQRNTSSVVAFKVGEDLAATWGEDGVAGDYHFQLTASHSDSPTFKVKAVPELDGAGETLRLNTEAYGGMIDYTWFDRPLALAGRVLVREGDRIESRLLATEREVAIIPSLAIHMNRGVNEGFAPNRAVDLCPSAKKAEEEVTIGVVTKSKSSEYWLSVCDGMEDAAEKYNVDVVILSPDAETEENVQKNMIRDLLKTDIQALAVSPINSYDSETYVKEAREKGISVYACDTPMEDSDVPYIGIDNEKLGYELGEKLAEALNHEGNIGVIAGDFQQAGHRMRVAGFEKYMEKETGINIEMVRNGYSNMCVSQKDVDEIFTKYPDIDGIMTTSAVTALGLSEAVEGRGISIVSVDAQEDALKVVQDGQIVALGAQSGYQIGYETIHYIVKDLQGEGTGEDEILDSQVLTTENIDAYIKEDKYSSS